MAAGYFSSILRVFLVSARLFLAAYGCLDDNRSNHDQDTLRSKKNSPPLYLRLSLRPSFKTEAALEVNANVEQITLSGNLVFQLNTLSPWRSQLTD